MRSKILEAWDPGKTNQFRAYYPCTSNQFLASVFGISKSSVAKIGRILKLKKLPIQFEKGRFNKGHQPPNKGQTMSPEVRERVKHTWFKKGNKPGNTLHDGAITTRRDKSGYLYKYIRISEGNWELLHRHLWREHHPEDELTSNDVIRFKDGNSLNCEISNLEKITLSENLFKNQLLPEAIIKKHFQGSEVPEDLIEVKKHQLILSKTIRDEYNKN